AAGLSAESMADSQEPPFEATPRRVPAPLVEEAAFPMLAANPGYDDYPGTLPLRRITRGSVKPSQWVAVLTGAEGEPRRVKVGQVLLYRGLGKEPVEEAFAGDIAVLTGLEEVTIGDTLADPESPDPLPRISIDEPTVRMTLGDS